MTLREHTGRTVEFRLLERNTNIDFAEDWLNAGALQRDVDGAYLVDSIDYILDYVKDAINGCNQWMQSRCRRQVECKFILLLIRFLLDSVCGRSKMLIS